MCVLGALAGLLVGTAALGAPPSPEGSGKVGRPAGARKKRPSPGVIAEARRRFTRGNRHYRRGNYSEALLAYQAALDLYEEPVILYNMAQTYEKLRSPAKAALLFQRYLNARPKTRDRAAVLERIDKLKRAARLPVSVTSYPPGAAIYVGDRDRGVRGRTPAELKLPLGKQVVMLELAGFIPERRTVEVRLGGGNLLDVQLQRKTSIRVDADVPGARAFIDSDTESQSHRVPHLFEVDPGRHLVHVELDGYQRVKRNVEVEAGDQVSLLVNLKALPKFGRLRVEGQPGAAVVVDGRTRAHLPMRPLKLAVGTYRVAVLRSGFRRWEGKININPKRLTNARVTLTPLRGVVTKTAVYGSLGLSVSAAIAGTVFGALALRTERDYQQVPDRPTADAGQNQALLSDIFFIAAGAAALAATVTYLATMRGDSEADISFSELAPAREARR